MNASPGLAGKDYGNPSSNQSGANSLKIERGKNRNLDNRLEWACLRPKVTRVCRVVKTHQPRIINHRIGRILWKLPGLKYVISSHNSQSAYKAPDRPLPRTSKNVESARRRCSAPYKNMCNTSLTPSPRTNKLPMTKGLIPPK